MARGFREIVLTGVDLTSWGGDLPDRPTFGSLVRAILRAVPELERLRLSSLDCMEADADLRAAFAEEERLMPYLHLSLQSGDDLILKRMKRRHARRDAVALCDELRRLRPGHGLRRRPHRRVSHRRPRPWPPPHGGLIEDCGLAFLHVFPFSPRPGTPAARMPPVAPGLAKERAGLLREEGDRALRRHLRGQIGRRLPVLAERGGRGRAPDFTPVATGAAVPGTITPLVIAGHDGRKLFGRNTTGTPSMVSDAV